MDVFGRVVCNPADSSAVITTCGGKFLLPSRSSFLLSDISKICLLCGAYVCEVIVPLVSVMVHIVGQYRVNFSLVPRPFIQRVPYIVYYVYMLGLVGSGTKTEWFLCPVFHSCLYTVMSSATRKYSLIVIDPPWENRSAIRGKK